MRAEQFYFFEPIGLDFCIVLRLSSLFFNLRLSLSALTQAPPGWRVFSLSLGLVMSFSLSALQTGDQADQRHEQGDDDK